MVEIDTLCNQLPVAWTAADQRALEDELSPYVDALRGHLSSGQSVPSHIEGSGCLQAPITEVTDPHQLFHRAAQEGAGVGLTRYEAIEYDDYWITVHPSDTDRQPPVPVVMLLLKRHPGPLPRLADLCARASEAVGARVGGCVFLAWNLPRFHWELHTDDEYEAVYSRVHLPLRTTPENLYVWARDRKSAWGDWLFQQHLEQGKLYHVRVDVPHTVVNNHPNEGRLHLILDVDGPFKALRRGA
jgi:hypothetical protein